MKKWIFLYPMGRTVMRIIKEDALERILLMVGIVLFRNRMPCRVNLQDSLCQSGRCHCPVR